MFQTETGQRYQQRALSFHRVSLQVHLSSPLPRPGLASVTPLPAQRMWWKCCCSFQQGEDRQLCPVHLYYLLSRCLRHRQSLLNMNVKHKGRTIHEQNTQCWILATILAVMGLPDIPSGNEHQSDTSTQSFTPHAPIHPIFQSLQERAQKASSRDSQSLYPAHKHLTQSHEYNQTAAMFYITDFGG